MQLTCKWKTLGYWRTLYPHFHTQDSLVATTTAFQWNKMSSNTQLKSSSTETSYFSTPKDILRHRLHSHCATSPWYHSLLPEEKNVISMLSDRPEIFFSQVNQIHSIMSVMTWSPTWCSKTAPSTCQCNPPSRHRPPWYGLTWLQCSIQQLFFLVVQCSSLLLGPSSGTKMMDGVIQPSVILVHHFCSWGNPEQQVKTLVPIWS